MTTTPHRPTIATLGAHDGTPAAATLASAFLDDPVFEWFAPDAAARRDLLPAWFHAVTTALVPHQRSRSTADHQAVALWVPPATQPLDEEQEQRVGEATEPFGEAAAQRFVAISEAMEAVHPTEPHHYLWFLGVAPARQGQGLGGALLTTYLAEVDQQGEAAYLEATTPRNRDLYARHGFEVTGVVRAAGSPPLWAMWRAPR